MFRAILTRWAKLSYRAKLEREAGLQIWMGRVQQAKGAAERKQATDMKADADAREARIKEMAEMEEKGFFTCENGHEQADAPSFFEGKEITAPKCDACGKPLTLIKRATMSGQEKYESDKDRKESEDMLADLRTQIEAHEKQAGVHEAAADYFMTRAKQARAEADEVRRV
jgi:hypothetical protein